MCFGCSKEPSHWDSSFEYPQHMFWLRNKKDNFTLRTLIWRPWHCVVSFRMTLYPLRSTGSTQEYRKTFGHDWNIVAQSVVSLIADPGVVRTWSHTFVDIDREIFSTVIILHLLIPWAKVFMIIHEFRILRLTFPSTVQLSKHFEGKIVIIFLPSNLNMFWVLKRIVSLRPFFWVPTTYVLVEK